MDKVAVSNIVSAIIAKNEVIIGADAANGVVVHIKSTTEIFKDHGSPIKLADLIKSVDNALK